MPRATTTQRMVVPATPAISARARERLEAMYTGMQAPGMREAMRSALAAPADELADAAVAAVRNRR
jgi:hypothetical protein